MAAVLLSLYAESPVHAGGDGRMDVIDMPIQREANSGLPVIWGQSLKGALRGHARNRWGSDPRIVNLFGDPPHEGGGRPARPGRVAVGDAQLLAFPVPTVRATFAWATSPLLLNRLRRRCRAVALAAGGLPVDTPAASDHTALAASPQWVSANAVIGPYVINCEHDDACTRWAAWLADQALPGLTEFEPFRRKLEQDLIAIGDATLTAVTRECAEVTPRIQLGEEAKTAENLFYSEYLPTETMLVALIEAPTSDDLDALHELLDDQVLHLGGDETIGKGLMWTTLVGTPMAGDGEKP
jgi:CRISPR-associated protein Cmr4